MSKRTVIVWLSWLALFYPRPAAAQLAPTGSHYAGRPSDTGHTGPNDRGGYTTSIPLDLPPARGGLPIPVQIVSGTRGFGAAGVGWDVPLSFVHVDQSFARRRPAMKPDAPLSPRQRITVSLPGRQSEMVPDGSQWIGRYAPDLRMRYENGTWKVFDGNGLTYTFADDPQLFGTGMSLLYSIEGAGGARVVLEYTVAQPVLPDSTEPAVSIDLARVKYNPHPSSPDCFKHEVALGYAIPLNPTPQSLSIFGERVLVRDHRLAVVDVMSRADCSSPHQRLRRYALSYQLDPDTQRERLASVRVFGRAGTPEASVSLPVASYSYGSATSPGISGGNVLRYQSSAPITVTLPQGADSIADTAKTTTLFHSPIAGQTSSYVTQNNFLDMTGDGRPDLVFEDYGQIWIARNVPGPAGTTTFAPPAQLSDGALTTPYLEARSSEVDRFGYTTGNREYVWRQAIDVNGDGRIDLIDASEKPKTWMIYLNTPGSTASGIQWVKRAYDVEPLYQRFEQLSLAVEGGYLPLSRRFTGVDHNEWMCWSWDSVLGEYVVDPDALYNEDGCLPGFFRPPPPPLPGYNPEKTFVEWEVRDINGDSYPDVTFNSSPVVFATEPPPPPVVKTQPHVLDVAVARLRPVDRNTRVEAVLNVRGLSIHDPYLPGSPTYPFSAPTVLHVPDCGYPRGRVVGLWSGTMDPDRERQKLACGFVEVNGDGIVDRINGRVAYLGAGSGITTTSIVLPVELKQESTRPEDCPKPGDPPDPTNPDPSSHAYPTSALRDVTGDGVPDFIQRDTQYPQGVRVYVGTGAGFTGGPLLGAGTYPGTPIDVEGYFGISQVDERCFGTRSRTVGGLYDVDGDGKPETVRLDNVINWKLHVYPLVGGSTWGVPEVGRITRIENGYGARTTISYRSAKEDATTRHQVPFPEIVVSAIETTGTQELGGTLAKTEYAYGHIELFYDSMVDGFRTAGYARTVQLTNAPERVPRTPQATATIVDRYPFDPVTPVTIPFLTPEQRFGRYLRAGRIRDVTHLAGYFGADVWSLLDVDVETDARRIANTHHDITTVDTRLLSNASPPGGECQDLMFPYEFEDSQKHQHADYNPCFARGFLFTRATLTWRGSAGPPSANNVQTLTSVRSVDDYGRVTSVFNQNDAARPDDDFCVDLTYADPTSSNEQVLTAVASRKVWNCGIEGGSIRVYAEESWDYDKLFHGLVSQGQVTAHTIYRHATDTGNHLGTIREYDVDYNAVGNPVRITRMREDGATRTSTIDYDAFGLSPVRTAVQGSGVPTLETLHKPDPVSGELLASTDANGTIRGTSFDGFGRPSHDTIEGPGVTRGVLAARSYFGFEGGDPLGRRIVVKEFTDPVDEKNIVVEEGQVRTTYLDELGRPRFAQIDLGDDYGTDDLIVGKRVYDLLGRVTFEADPFPTSQDPETAYGTTQYFRPDGLLWVAIRGHGEQPFTTTPDASQELYPTVFQHTFANHVATSATWTADALTPGTPQFGVRREAVSTAIGRELTRSTWQNGTRLEHAQLAYDRIGGLTKMIRYQNAVTAANPVEWTWQLDSLGQMLRLTEPLNAPQERTYSNWGELVDVTWRPPAPEPTHSIAKKYDALGRLVQSEERNAGVTDPVTVSKYEYDVAVQTSPLVQPTNVIGRLSLADSPTASVSFSYDAFGNVNARTHTASDKTTYVEQHRFHADGAQAWIELNLPDNNYATERVEYEYDTAGQLRWMWFSDGTNTEELFNAKQVDPWGRLRHAWLGKSLEYAAYYAETGRRMIKEVKVGAGSEARSVAFTGFDPVGRELSRSEDMSSFSGDQTAVYDALGRLSSSVKSQSATPINKWTFAYDPLGNVFDLTDHLGNASIGLSYQAADRDRICRIYGSGFGGIGCNVGYDSFGNIVEQPTRTGYNKLEYFHSGDVRRIENESGATATFRYDAFGHVQQLEVESSATVRSDRHFGAFLTQRHHRTPFNETRYLSRQFPGPGLTISRRGADGPWIFQFIELRGTRFTADRDGRFVQDLDYTPYGKASSKGAEPGTPEFSTQQWNEGDALEPFGLVHLGARVYDPAIGRFLSRDPLLIPRTSATSNPYAFAFNDPINFSDPSGLDPNACPPGMCQLWASNNGSDSSGLLAAVIAGTIGALWMHHFGQELPNYLSSSNQVKFYNSGFDARFEALQTSLVPQDGVSGALGGIWDYKVSEADAVLNLPDALADQASQLHSRISGGVGATARWWGGSPAVLAGHGRSTAGTLLFSGPSGVEGIIEDFDGLAHADSTRTGVKHTLGLAAGVVGMVAGPARAVRGVRAGEAGAYGSLRARSVPKDMLTPHHMPQAAMGFTTSAQGGSLVLPHSEHIRTRTFGGRGGATLRAEQGMSFRNVLARDMRNIRQLFGPKYDQGLRDLLQYYRQNFPELMAR